MEGKEDVFQRTLKRQGKGWKQSDYQGTAVFALPIHDHLPRCPNAKKKTVQTGSRNSARPIFNAVLFGLVCRPLQNLKAIRILFLCVFFWGGELHPLHMEVPMLCPIGAVATGLHHSHSNT